LELRANERRALELRVSELSALELRPVEVRVLGRCKKEVRPIEDRPGKIDMPNIGAGQVRASQVAISERQCRHPPVLTHRVFILAFLAFVLFLFDDLVQLCVIDQIFSEKVQGVDRPDPAIPNWPPAALRITVQPTGGQIHVLVGKRRQHDRISKCRRAHNARPDKPLTFLRP
jgi:hypothetical protein